jgi:hypothetical protein
VPVPFPDLFPLIFRKKRKKTTEENELRPLFFFGRCFSLKPCKNCPWLLTEDLLYRSTKPSLPPEKAVEVAWAEMT